ncbi:MAG: hypothetical protein NTW29_12615 [Bacteroidetes bacterium]|nr:hypothetical protein [Bacteroidota bacterium]
MILPKAVFLLTSYPLRDTNKYNLIIAQDLHSPLSMFGEGSGVRADYARNESAFNAKR